MHPEMQLKVGVLRQPRRHKAAAMIPAHLPTSQSAASMANLMVSAVVSRLATSREAGLATAVEARTERIASEKRIMSILNFKVDKEGTARY